MIIQLATPTQLRITWPQYDAATEAEIVRRLRTVPGVDGMGHRYYAPVIQTARLMEFFPRASFDYAAMQAADNVGRMFWESLVRMGIELRFDESRGVYVVLGANCSPLLEQIVSERSHALRPFVLEAMATPQPEPQPQRAMRLLTEDDLKWETWLKGVKNAAAKEEEQAMRYPRRKRRAKKERVA